MADPNKEKEQQTSEEGYDYQKEVQSINDRYQKAEENLSDSYTKQEETVAGAYDTQIGGYDEFLGQVIQKQRELGIKSEEQEKKANAFRYIAGIGDAISGVANLVGTAHGAVNQQQEYNAPGVMAKAEEMRKERKLEMEQLNARLDELRAQKAVLEGTRDLKLGELEGKKASELLGLELQKGRDITAAGQMGREESWRQKQFEESGRQFDETKALQREQMEQSASQFKAQEERLRTQHEEEIAARKEIAEINAKAREEAAKLKIQSDPKKQAEILTQNIVGVRDELAQKMGYKDYNEYLRYQRGGKVDGVGKRAAKQTRKERSEQHPEIEQLMLDLSMPDELTATKLAAIATASKVFADAMDKATVVMDPAKDSNL